MGRVIDRVKSAFSKNKEEEFKRSMTGVVTSDLSVEVYYKELAIQSCISFIANALIMSEFQTFEAGQEVKGETYYLFNVEPNLNQNAVEFWHEVIYRLIYDNECLVVLHDKQFFVAESFDHKEFAFKPDIYTNVVIRGLTMRKVFIEEDVLYFKLNNKHIKKLIDGLYADYGQLITGAVQSFKKASGRKGVFYKDSFGPVNGPEFEKEEKMIESNFKNYFNAINAALNLSKGDKYEESPQSAVGKDSRDIRNLINDVIDFSCAAFHMPGGLVRGDVVGVESLTDNAIAFGIKPFAELITAEVNRKYYGRQYYLDKWCMKMDVTKIKLVSIKELADAAEKMFRIGVHNVNENRELFAKSYIDEDWANQYYVTKNYSNIIENNENQNLKGGDVDGTNDGNEIS